MVRNNIKIFFSSGLLYISIKIKFVWIKKKSWNCLQKQRRFVAASDLLFQSLAPSTVKDLLPCWRWVLGIHPVSTHQRIPVVSSWACRLWRTRGSTEVHVAHGGLYVRDSVSWWVGRQCRDFRTGVICSCLCTLTNNRAASVEQCD